MISLAQLLEETSNYCPNAVLHRKGSYSYKNLSLLFKGPQDFANDVVYVGLASVALELLDFIDDVTLFLVKDCSLPYDTLTSRKIFVVEYPPEIGYFMLYTSIRSLFCRKWDLLNNSSVLLNALLNSSSLDDLAETAAHLTQNPIQIMDVSYKVLAYSKSMKVEDELWRQTNELGGFTFEYIAAIQNFNTSKVLPKDNCPYYLETPMSPSKRFISRIYADGTHLGYLIALESNQCFKEINTDLFKLISEVIAKTIKSDKELHIQKDYRTFESILIDLIEGNTINNSSILKVKKDLNLVQKSSFLLISLNTTNYSLKNPKDNYLKTSINSAFPKAWSFHYKEHIIILLSLVNRCNPSIQEKCELDKLCNNSDLYAGISDVFTDLHSISLYYSQAIKSVNLARLLQSPGRVFEYEIFKFHDMVLSLTKGNEGKNDLKKYCSSLLLDVETHDRDHSTEYLKTLWTYLNSNKNLIKTAQKLFIHKNTAAYRIQKLEEHFSINMDDDYLLFRLYYSYLLLTCPDL